MKFVVFEEGLGIHSSLNRTLWANISEAVLTMIRKNERVFFINRKTLLKRLNSYSLFRELGSFLRIDLDILLFREL